MQYKGRGGFKPTNVLRLATPGNDGKARGLVGVKLHHVFALLEQLGIPVEREVTQDGVVLGETHVMRQPWPRQRDRYVVRQLVVPVNHTVVHVGRMLGVIEKKHLASGRVDLHVGRDAVQRRPGWNTLLLQREGVEPVALAALVVGRECASGMHHHIGARGVFDRAVRAPARPA